MSGNFQQMWYGILVGLSGATVSLKTYTYTCITCTHYFVQVIWKCLYKQSSRDHGTLGYFRSLLNRVTVTNDPKKCVDATIDFLTTTVKGHILACALKWLGVSKLDSKLQLPPGIYKASKDDQLLFLCQLAAQVVEQCTLIEGTYTNEQVRETGDGVYNYARVLCHFGTLVMEFRDAWAEGDGDRIFQCWQLFMPHFIACGRTKYSLEALRLQFQVKAVLSPQLAHQIKWDRFVNTRGGMGKNIPCDLHNEHVNKLLKGIIANMGSNLTEDALQRAARSISTISAICKSFDQWAGVPVGTTAHSTRSDKQDIAKVTAAVLKNDLLSISAGRKHHAFPQQKTNPLHNWNKEKTKQWIETKQKQFMKFRGCIRRESSNEIDSEATHDED